MTNEELLSTDFGEEIEKLAAEQVEACQEAYAYGCEKLAAEAAEEMDKEDKKEDDKEDKKEKMDGESEKAAAELGAFIERGFFDGLRKLGSERHGDEFHYIAPYVEQKIAAAGAETASKVVNAIKGYAKSTGKAVKDYHQGAANSISKGAKELTYAARGKGESMPGIGAGVGKMSTPMRKALAGEGAKNLGKGALKLSPYAAAAGLGGYGVSKAVSSKKED